MDSELDLAIKEIVTKLKDEPDAPEAVVAAACKVIAVEVSSAVDSAGAKVAITTAARCVMTTMLLFEKDLPRTAVALLAQMPSIAQKTGLDPAEGMTWAIEGIVEACKMAPGAVSDAVRAAINDNFMGAGSAFDKPA